MPRNCTVCEHARRAEIDSELVARPGSLRDIAERFGLTKSAVHRHSEAHLPAALVQAKAADEASKADDLLEKVRELEGRIQRALDQAEKAKDVRSIFAGARELREVLRLLAELRGRLQSGPTFNVAVFTHEPSPALAFAELELAADELGFRLVPIVTTEGHTLPGSDSQNGEGYGEGFR